MFNNCTSFLYSNADGVGNYVGSVPVVSFNSVICTQNGHMYVFYVLI